MHKVLVSDKLAPEGVRILEESGFTVDCKYGLEKEELKKIIKDYDAIVIRSDTKLSEDVLEAAVNLKFVGRAGVGTDNVDKKAATKKGIVVMNAPGGNTVSTCEHAFSMMLATARKIPFAYASMQNKEWKRSQFKGVELNAKTLGIVGLGRIGKEMAKRALSFNMEVVAVDPFISREAADALGIKLVDLEQLLKVSDFITVHTPLTEETRGMIGAGQLAMMKKNAFIINCARGGIVDEAALVQALKDRKIAGAALDVFENEPPFDSELMGLDNLVMTPHLGASTEEAQVNVAVEIAYCIRDALQGRAIRNAVNYIQLDPEAYRILKPFMELAELMGKFISQLLDGRPEALTLSYIGEIAAQKVDPLSLSFAKGFLSHVLEEDVNLVNALAIAKERGIKVEQSKLPEELEYVNLIRARIKTDKAERVIEGTLFANRKPRFVKLDDFYIEINPSPVMVVLTNWDKPGVVGSMGTILGAHKINIAGMSLGRQAPEGVAVTVLNIDTVPDDEVVKEILANNNVISFKRIKL